MVEVVAKRQNYTIQTLKVVDDMVWARAGKTLAVVVRNLHQTTRIKADFSHAIIGGGIIGTAIGAELQKIAGNRVLIVEQHDSLAFETTSRNSEVIHAGLYYPKDSLKARLCIEGKNKIYHARDNGVFDSVQVGLQQCGKWVVAQTPDEGEYLEKLHKNAQELGVPVSFVSSHQAAKQFPRIRAEYGVLESPTTGIISAHDYTLFFETMFENNDGTLGLNTELVDIEYSSSIPEYTLILQELGSESTFLLSCDNLINAAGLHAPRVFNMLLPQQRHLTSHFAKGNYFSYLPTTPIKSSEITTKLIYPCPNPNASSLGTHLTLDLGGQLKFGPDLEWLDIQDARDIDYRPSSQNLHQAYEAIKTYYPSIQPHDILPSYSGVRPKILSREQSFKQFADFIIREEEGFPGFINLLGIESPGLTSAWAIADYVKDIYHR